MTRATSYCLYDTCIHIYTHTHVYIFVCVCVYIHAHICACLDAFLLTFLLKTRYGNLRKSSMIEFCSMQLTFDFNVKSVTFIGMLSSETYKF